MRRRSGLKCQPRREIAKTNSPYACTSPNPVQGQLETFLLTRIGIGIPGEIQFRRTFYSTNFFTLAPVASIYSKNLLRLIAAV
jgi:hypothetical protein